MVTYAFVIIIGLYNTVIFTLSCKPRKPTKKLPIIKWFPILPKTTSGSQCGVTIHFGNRSRSLGAMSHPHTHTMRSKPADPARCNLFSLLNSN